MRRSWLPVVLLILVTPLAGCRSGNLSRVKGVVTLDGQPLAGAEINLIPVGGKGRAANAHSDAKGRFSIGTVKEGDGAWPGEYKVTVIKRVMDPMLTQKLDKSDPQGAIARREQLNKAIGSSKRTYVPLRYGDANQTPFTVTVPTSSELQLDVSTK